MIKGERKIIYIHSQHYGFKICHIIFHIDDGNPIEDNTKKIPLSIDLMNDQCVHVCLTGMACRYKCNGCKSPHLHRMLLPWLLVDLL